MRSREDLIKALVSFSEPVESLLAEIQQYGWDCESELIELTPEHIRYVLHLYLSGKVSENRVTDWANAIEQRDDIGLLDTHREVLNEMIFWLANPEINFGITKDLAMRIIDYLNRNSIV